MAELEIIDATGMTMSDAAKVAYVESGGSMDAAMAASQQAHEAAIASWGSEESEVLIPHGTQVRLP